MSLKNARMPRLLDKIEAEAERIEKELAKVKEKEEKVEKVIKKKSK